MSVWTHELLLFCTLHLQGSKALIASQVHLHTFSSQTPRCPFCVDRGQLDEELGISSIFISVILDKHQLANSSVHGEARCQCGPFDASEQCYKQH